MSTGEPVPAHVDEFLSATAAAVATTPTTSSIFPIAAAGATAIATAIAGVIVDVGFVHGDAVASPHATLLSPPAWHG